MELPIKIEGIIYAKTNENHEFLLLKRTPEEGGFWQPVTGTLEEGETLELCLKREIFEETGISELKRTSQIIYEFEWQNKKGKTITEYVYAVEVTRDVKITVNPSEHSEYKWVSYKSALHLLEKENNKNAFKKLNF